uniref:Calcium/calmodulin-dependent protein kinase I n=1 Tax=Tetraselmis sp. GSL018 TaxID=582737 RepID=A0A061SDZ9_9CHLO
MGGACSRDVSDTTTPSFKRAQKGGADPTTAQDVKPVPEEGASSGGEASNRSMKQKKSKRKVREVYKLGKTLGTGGFSVVKMAVHRQTNEQYACKVMALPPPGAELDDSSNTREDIIKEIQILCKMEHPNVIFLKEFFDEGNKVYLITELLTGGELLDALLAKGSYTEEDARCCFEKLLAALSYLHKQEIAHRDLKLENLLLVDSEDITNIKLADFGLAKGSVQQQSMKTVCGTPQYVAPEIINEDGPESYGIEVDMWSAGIVLFILLGGYPPFYDESEPRLFAAIQKGKFGFEDEVWDEISDLAKDLIRKLIVVDPKKRLTADEALRHPWVTGKQAQKELKGTRQNMESRIRQNFRAKVKSVMAANRMKIMGAVAAGKSGKDEDEDEEDEDELLRKQGIRLAKVEE